MTLLVIVLIVWPRDNKPGFQVATGPEWVREPPVAVPSTLFGVTVTSGTGMMPSFRVGAVRLWNSGTQWSLIEPQRDTFNWETLDRLVGAAERARLPVLFTFGCTPGWASPGGQRASCSGDSRASPPDDLADWDTFVRAVATKYRGRIGAYEVWALAPNPQTYSGDARQLAEMARRASRIVRESDPSATVVCPGMPELWDPPSRQFLLDFAAAGGYQDCHVAAVKLHPRDAGDKPETMVQLIEVIYETFRQAGLAPRLWNTGTTFRYPTWPTLPEEQATDYAVRFYLVGLYGLHRGIERMYFYSWGGNPIPIVLQNVGGSPTPAARYVEELQRWLDGAEIRSCSHGLPDGLPANVWQCRFLLSTAYGKVEAAIRWTDTGDAVMKAEARTSTIRRLDGSSHTIHQGAELHITEQPILVQ